MVTERVNERIESLRRWAVTLPVERVSVRETPRPEDEYGSEVIFSFVPNDPEACALTVTLVPGDYCGVELDSWSRLAARGCFARRPQVQDDHPALFLEPQRLRGVSLLDLCQAVCDGRVWVETGVVDGRLFSTRGGLVLEDGFFELHGVGGPAWLASLWSLLGRGQRIVIPYRPW